MCGRERTAGTGTQLWARAKSKWFEITPAESPDVESVLTWDLLGAAPFWRVMCATRAQKVPDQLDLRTQNPLMKLKLFMENYCKRYTEISSTGRAFTPSPSLSSETCPSQVQPLRRLLYQ